MQIMIFCFSPPKSNVPLIIIYNIFKLGTSISIVLPINGGKYWRKPKENMYSVFLFASKLCQWGLTHMTESIRSALSKGGRIMKRID